MKKKIALLFGGAGCEHEISCRSAAAVLRAIDRKRFFPIPVGIGKDGGWYFFPADPDRIENGSVFSDTPHPVPTFPTRVGNVRGFLFRKKILPVDAVLPILHGDLGEDGTVAGVLTLAGLPFVGCDTVAGALAMDKAAAKALADSLGVPTVPWLLADSKDDPDAVRVLAEENIGYPMFVKPARLGSSVGASPARQPSDFSDAFRLAANAGGGNLLIERFLHPVREIECAYLAAGPLPILTAPGEIDTGDAFYSYEEKYGDGSHAKISSLAPLDPATSEKICQAAKAMISALGVRDLCRVDFFLTDGGYYFNEINTLPGLTAISLYPSMLARLGLSFTEVLTRLLLQAIRRGG